MAKKNNDNAGIGCAFSLVALVFAMPLIGIHLLSKKDSPEEDKMLGAILTVVGFILWFVILLNTN